MSAEASKGLVRPARRPAHWQSVGPLPPGDRGRPELQVQAGEDLCYLLGEWRIFQLQSGHRWSLDDLLTAWLAREACTKAHLLPQRILDLGCGIGSVLLMNAWNFGDARCLGIEAQELSVALARRSIAYNGIGERCEVIHADFRQGIAALKDGPPFDLITCTPPYFLPDHGLVSPLEQKGPCRFELRGGIEAYLAAAVQVLAPGGVIALCMAASQWSRFALATSAMQLAAQCRMQVVPKHGKEPLICLATVQVPQADAPPAIEFPPLVVRDADGQRTSAMQALRISMGMPP